MHEIQAWLGSHKRGVVQQKPMAPHTVRFMEKFWRFMETFCMVSLGLPNGRENEGTNSL